MSTPTDQEIDKQIHAEWLDWLKEGDDQDDSFSAFLAGYRACFAKFSQQASDTDRLEELVKKYLQPSGEEELRKFGLDYRTEPLPASAATGGVKEKNMSTKKKGMLTVDSEWRQHLRKAWRRIFWSKERTAEQRDVRQRIDELEAELEAERRTSNV